MYVLTYTIYFCSLFLASEKGLTVGIFSRHNVVAKLSQRHHYGGAVCIMWHNGVEKGLLAVFYSVLFCRVWDLFLFQMRATGRRYAAGLFPSRSFHIPSQANPAASLSPGLHLEQEHIKQKKKRYHPYHESTNILSPYSSPVRSCVRSWLEHSTDPL